MLKLLADENFHRHIVRGVLRQLPEVDLLRVQEVGLEGVDDATVLEWSANENRVLLTHDVTTIPNIVRQRIESGGLMPGVIFVPQPFHKQEIIDSLLIVIQCSHPRELDGIWIYLPLR